MTSSELKTKFFDYFQARGHKIIDSASLLPENDPSVLFITAGMQPLVPYLMGEKHPEGTRLANVQKCLRTDDIDEVGDTTHHTFFEMLGNWSLGDYFKQEVIEYSTEFLLGILKLDKEKIGISIFGGNDDVKEADLESEKHWLDQSFAKERIQHVKENWWGPAGETGPCGPDTEMFYWVGPDKAPKVFDENNPGWVEIWNDVLMQYNKTADGKYDLLKQKNVDTGMGLERTLAVLNGLDDNYRTELFWPIIESIEKLSGLKYGDKSDAEHLKEDGQCWVDTRKAFRIIADHIRTAVFVLGDHKGVTPSNKDQGYILRRIIRRSIRFGKQVGIKDNFASKLAQVVIPIYQDDYPELKHNSSLIISELKKEEIKFDETLEKGLQLFDKLVKQNKLDEKATFILFTTYGFPIEMTLEMASEKGIKLDEQKIDTELKQHQDLSRTASAGMFKGGLADDSENTKRHHTAAHLLLEALRITLGDHVQQKGSNINEDRIRFDFSHDEKMTDEQKQKVEDIVNEQINKAMPIHFEEMTVDQAKKIGATGVFEHKYGDKVKVYFMGDFSKEICGGPHVDNTSQLGQFKIKKEQSSSAGVRRIKATLT